LYAVLAATFGCLSVFAFVVPWARSVLPIALANLVLTVAMAVMNSVLLDMMEKHDEHRGRHRPQGRGARQG
jgi:hypothetical protein